MQRTGQVTVTTAGTAVQGGSAIGSLWAFAPHPDNTGIAYMGNDGAGDVTSANGFPLPSGSTIILNAGNLNEFYFDSTQDGDKVCWMRLA